MANAMGRLVGTILSGWLFQVAGLGACLWIRRVCCHRAAIISIALPRHQVVTITQLAMIATVLWASLIE
jgi:hypothetical protein